MSSDPGLSVLTADDEVRLAHMINAVGCDAPGPALDSALKELERDQKPALAAAFYEAVCYRVSVQDYWLHFRMWRIYHTLGPEREDAAFHHAAAAVAMSPNWSGSDQLYRDMFLIFVRHGRDRSALHLFRYQMQFQPERPAATPEELAPILRRLGESSALPARPRQLTAGESCKLHPIEEETIRPPWSCPTFGGDLPRSLVPLTQPMVRPAIVVAEFSDAEVFLYRNAVVVVDQAGNVADKFCVGDYPDAIHAKLVKSEPDEDTVPSRAVDDAVIISDHFPDPNICHFLFDQITRLALYRRSGVDIGQALVIGPQDALPAQRDILRRAGVTAYLATNGIVRVRAQRLWVSSNCRALRHPSHLGAEWAVEFIRETLGGRGTKGWRRLYLSRADANGRRVTNETEVVALLEQHGFEAIMPGRMGYDAQIAAFKNASHIIAPHGAALSHIVLCPPEAHVLEIFHPLYGTAAFATQVAAAGLRYAALLARDWESSAPAWNDPTVLVSGPSRFGGRHLSVDLDVLSRYLATVI